MQNQENATPTIRKRVPWNKGKLTGTKPPLRPKHVRSIRTKLQIEDRARDLAMFNLAIDSKLRGCDVVAIKVEDAVKAHAALLTDPGPKDRYVCIGSQAWIVPPHRARSVLPQLRKSPR